MHFNQLIEVFFETPAHFLSKNWVSFCNLNKSLQVWLILYILLVELLHEIEDDNYTNNYRRWVLSEKLNEWNVHTWKLNVNSSYETNILISNFPNKKTTIKWFYSVHNRSIASFIISAGDNVWLHILNASVFQLMWFLVKSKIDNWIRRRRNNWW